MHVSGPRSESYLNVPSRRSVLDKLATTTVGYRVVEDFSNYLSAKNLENPVGSDPGVIGNAPKVLEMDRPQDSTLF